ncbi:AAA family ATPase [Desulfomicrobium sp. ZS1]|uniref:AAA family ATPase n=1 Tax=Desulfomicrobium sp. ZS1 TaxID=2952228 RepID=UPI0020B313E6|nr:AAA family ATPase [Desulfomicrobium sp. ZS1]UTF50901.1 AAA family ATPase [Desulfomicrobium sp. ZS1]
MSVLVKDFAKLALERGLHPIGCRGDKKPIINREKIKDRPPTPGEIELWGNPMVGLICGCEVNPVLAIDFDQAGLFFEAYKARVMAERHELWARLTVEKTMNAGAHIWVRTKRPFMTQKLAHQVIEVECPGEYDGGGKPIDPDNRPKKSFKAFEHRGKWIINPDAIETRGATAGMGAYCVCAPSPGYELLQGKILSMPLLEDEEVDYLLSLAREFETYFPEPKAPKLKSEARTADGNRPGDDFNARGEILPILEKHGWTFVKQIGDRIHLARPGKTGGTSATLTDERIFYPFSSNSHPFEPYEAYAPFSVYAMLEHDGDFAAAAKDLSAQGYGTPEGESDWNRDGGQKAGKNAAKENHAQECLAGIFNGADLLEMDLPEVRWAVPDLLPQGLAILAGGPKLGKSWLIYSICAGMGAGCRVLGHFQTPQAKSLYLALEDGKRRLQDRMKALFRNEPAIKSGLSNVDFQITWPRFDDEGGLEKLESYVEENVPNGLKLVVIDTLAKVGPKSKSKGLNAYESDSIIMTRIKSMADKHGICILIVTHLSKLRTSKDPFDNITGSMGQFGTADTAMLLTRKRGASTATLQTTGRDIEGHSYELAWSNPGWSCSGYANEDEVDLTPERLAILQAFRDDGGSLSPNMVASTLGKTPSNTGKLIKKLVEEGFLFSVGYGMYSLIPSVPSGGSTPSVPSVTSPEGTDGQVGILGIDSLRNGNSQIVEGIL